MKEAKLILSFQEMFLLGRSPNSDSLVIFASRTVGHVAVNFCIQSFGAAALMGAELRKSSCHEGEVSTSSEATRSLLDF